MDHVAVRIEHFKEPAHVGTLEVLRQIHKHTDGGDGILMCAGLVANSDWEAQVANADLVDAQLAMVAFLLDIYQRCLVFRFHIDGEDHSTTQ